MFLIFFQGTKLCDEGRQIIYKLISRIPDSPRGNPLSISLDRTGPCSENFARKLTVAFHRLTNSDVRGRLRLLGLVASNILTLQSCTSR